jgi:dTDP-4-dehydrorhamnose reductase
MIGRLRARDDLELWAGIECTVNRVGDRYIDQIAMSGHAARESDLELVHWLGARAVRYPVLWERVAPEGLRSARWAWSDRRLHRLRALGVRPIIGLLHHGSGPHDTNLLDPAFPQRLASYARAVAERYPWALDWTPVNEPLTTARLSAMYGHWYPHARSFPEFVRAVLNQCAGIRMAMREIRTAIPAARLIQTEDFSRVSGTPSLTDRAALDQRIRLLSLDLLTGAVDERHPLWRDLLAAGATEAELREFAEPPLQVDVVGLNYYVTSDRYLDDRLGSYPPALHGGDGRLRYVDVEAVRVAGAELSGHRAMLEAAWRRYRRPLAITEVHLGSARDEQLRWLAEAWRGAGEAKDAGVDVRAVTAWSLLGSFGWDRLVVEDQGNYEPGLFDLRGPAPRPTALAHAVRALAHGEQYDSPALDSVGWWRRGERVAYPDPVGSAGAERARGCPEVEPGAADSLRPRALVITGAGGTLGQALARVARARGLRAVLLTRRGLDVTDRRAADALFGALQPWAVINAAGFVRVDDAEHEPDRCRRENVDGAVTIAAAAAAAGARVVTFSSDLVFDGRSEVPYREEATPRPLNVYGRTKAEAEERVLAEVPHALVIRTAAFFGPWDRHNFVAATLAAIGAGTLFAAADDVRVSPTYVPDLANAVLDLLLDGEEGVWHLANDAAVSWYELARRTAALTGRPDAAELIQATTAQALGWRARRPAFSALGSARGQMLGSLDEALQRCLPVPGAQHEHNGSLGE